jgi:hypothetical protein
MRVIDSGILAALTAETVRFIYMVRIDFDSGTVAWNSGFRDITYGTDPLGASVVYMGLGEVSSISGVSEELGVKAASLNVGMFGIKPETVALILGEPYVNRKAFVYFTLLDENDVQIAGAPVLIFRGTINQPSGDMGASASFTIELSSRLADWQRPRASRYTDAEQQKLHPGDKGMEFVAELSKRKLIWPRAAFLLDYRDKKLI